LPPDARHIMQLFFIRHGQTTGDVEGRYGGDYDDCLMPEGIEQSRRIAEQLKGRGLGLVISSPLTRAQETAKFIAEAAGCPHVVRAALRERNRYGILTGLTKAEARNKHPALVAALDDRMSTIDGAEPYEEFRLRIHGAFRDVVAGLENSTAEAAAVVWHGGPMRILASDILELGEIAEVADCALVELEKDGDAWRVKRLEGIKLK
jgi:probable phosphoglycerate mutase